MIRINLLPVRAEKKRETIRLQLTIAGLVVFLVLAVLGMLYLMIGSDISQIKEDIATAEAEQVIVAKKIGKLSEIKKQKEVVQGKLDVVKRLEKGRVGPTNLFLSVERSIPELAWIENFNEKGRIITLSGGAAAQNIVVDFLENLKKEKEIGRVDLIESRRAPGKKSAGYKRDIVNFKITIERKRN